MKKLNRIQLLNKKHRVIRKKIFGTSQRPRLCIRITNKNVICQIIDDVKMKTIIYVLNKGKNKASVMNAAKILSKNAKNKKITSIVFDRSGYFYGGKIKIFADECRKSGLEF